MRFAIVLLTLGLCAQTLPNDSTTPPGPKAPEQYAPALTGNFFERLAQAYSNDWHDVSTGPAAPYRGDPAPVDNPPFPFTV
jgi:hypothetical protein